MNTYHRVDESMKLRYRKSLSEMEISDVPGYWRDKEAQMHQGHPLHMCVGCDGPFKATYTYLDHCKDEKGRFQSIYKSWKELKEQKYKEEVNA